METAKRLIWSSAPAEDEWRADYEEWCEANGIDPDCEDYDDWASQACADWLIDERMNLDKEVGCVVSICEMGLWSGSRMTAHILGSNLGDIFDDPGNYRSIEDAEWYGQDGDIRGTLMHHDGADRAVYRKCASAAAAEELLGRAESWEEVMEGTESLYPDVAAVYGWID